MGNAGAIGEAAGRPYLALELIQGPTLARYFEYYHQAHTHLALDKDAPDIRPIQLPEAGTILQIPEVGGLHHRYVRRAA